MPQINNLERIYFIFLLGGSVTIYCETCLYLGCYAIEDCGGLDASAVDPGNSLRVEAPENSLVVVAPAVVPSVALRSLAEVDRSHDNAATDTLGPTLHSYDLNKLRGFINTVNTIQCSSIILSPPLRNVQFDHNNRRTAKTHVRP